MRKRSVQDAVNALDEILDLLDQEISKGAQSKTDCLREVFQQLTEVRYTIAEALQRSDRDRLTAADIFQLVETVAVITLELWKFLCG